MYIITQDVYQWGADTFGVPKSYHAKMKSVLRMIEETDELLDELLALRAALEYVPAEQEDVQLTFKNVREELADVIITAMTTMGTLGVDPLQDVDEKMRINKRRKWVRHGDGTGHHVKTDEDLAQYYAQEADPSNEAAARMAQEWHKEFPGNWSEEEEPKHDGA